MTANQLATTIGRGLVAGVAGTAAMTVSSTVEAKLRHRAFSTAPADAAAKVLGIKEFTDESAHSRSSCTGATAPAGDCRARCSA
jgi:hypothetical protein